MSVCEGSGELREEGSQNTRRVSGCPGFSAGRTSQVEIGIGPVVAVVRKCHRSKAGDTLPAHASEVVRGSRSCRQEGGREGGREGGSERETGRRTWWEWWVGVGWGGAVGSIPFTHLHLTASSFRLFGLFSQNMIFNIHSVWEVATYLAVQPGV